MRQLDRLKEKNATMRMLGAVIRISEYQNIS